MAHTETGAETAPRTERRPNHRWRVVDIVTAAVLAVAVGVIFWAWIAATNVIDVPFSALAPGLQGFPHALWVLGGVLGGLIIRKPGAALFVELVAATIEALMGNQWGLMTVVYGAVQGLAAEAVFAIFRYRVWKLPVALLAGATAGLAMAVLDIVTYYAGQVTATFQLLYVISGVAGGVVLAGSLAWVLTRALAATGALSRFASGRTSTLV